MMHKLLILGWVVKCTLFVLALSYMYILVSNYVSATRIYRLIKEQLKEVKDRELSNNGGSSSAQYAVRADSLKYQYLSDRMFKNYIWKIVERKLQSDIQIEK